MSYILDAIKRSERQRLNSGMAALRAAPLFADAEPPAPLLLYGAAAAILIAAGIVIGWLRPWHHDDAPGAMALSAAMAAAPVPEQQAGALDSPAEPAHAASPRRPDLHVEKVEELQPMKVKPYRAPAPAEKPSAAQSTPTAPAAALVPQAAKQGIAQGGKEADSSAVQIAAPAKADAVVASAVASQPPGPVRVLALNELPPEVLRDIPAMSISGYSYSAAPAERMVGINDRLVLEGQYIAEGLKLEQITPDGLIFSYKSYRFLKKLQ